MHGEAIGFGETPVVAISYLAMGLVMLGCARFAVATPKSDSMHEEPSDEHMVEPSGARDGGTAQGGPGHVAVGWRSRRLAGRPTGSAAGVLDGARRGAGLAPRTV